MNDTDTATRPKLATHTKILIGFAVGALLGLVVNAFGAPTEGGAVRALAPWAAFLVDNVADPIGKIFLRLLLMIVVPIVVTSLTLGVAGIGNPRKLGRIGVRSFAWTLVISGVSVVLGLTLANTIRPGERVPQEIRDQLFAAQAGNAASAVAGALHGKEKSAVESIIELVPDNPIAAAARTPPDMLALMVFSVILGIALASAGEDGKPLTTLLESAFAVLQKVIVLVMKLAPIGVGALLFAMTARFGFSLLTGLAAFVVTVLAGLAFHMLVFYSVLLRGVARVSPREFFRRVRTVMATAFATSSSNATLPTALRVAEQRLQIPNEIASFVLTVGATANQNGTALFEGVTILFLAQLFGVDLTLSQQLLVLGMAILAGVGTAGVPAGSIPFIIIVLQTVGVPPEGIAVILGVDRLLDMCRTVPNVVGDLVLATIVARGEGVEVVGAES